MNEIYLIRHGHTKANEVDMIGGDYPLSHRGLSQIQSSKARFRSMGFDSVYTSELKRAKQTAKELFGDEVPVKGHLKEFNSFWFGNAEEKIVDANGRVVGIKTGFFGDFPAFLRECHGDNPFRRADLALEKMKYLSSLMDEYPERFSNNRIAIITSDTLIRSIVQQVRDRNKWDRISGKYGLPVIENLEYVKFIYDEGSLVDVEMPEQDQLQ